MSRAFIHLVRDGELPYRRLVVNDHIVDEAATRLEKQASMSNAVTTLPYRAPDGLTVHD
ncbi:hypothetical protein [Halomicrobium zhouii]|uniref:hypothetical protein n=1 Tax=Halomicrobium zhouii TaxID=767519 RepID=UPI0015A68D8D|nr:hypothetical protein [Halomicrobium zhouii]